MPRLLEPEFHCELTRTVRVQLLDALKLATYANKQYYSPHLTYKSGVICELATPPLDIWGFARNNCVVKRIMSVAAAAPRLAGKVAVVTGGARGIGLGCARSLCKEGAKVGVKCARGPSSAVRSGRYAHLSSLWTCLWLRPYLSALGGGKEARHVRAGCSCVPVLLPQTADPPTHPLRTHARSHPTACSLTSTLPSYSLPFTSTSILNHADTLSPAGGVG